MIINYDRAPLYSLYYLGGVIIQLIIEENNEIDELYYELKKIVKEDINIEFFYYALDWLFLLSIICIEENEVKLCK